MAGLAFPSWAYNATQPAQIVQSQAAFTALGTGWSFTPFAPPGTIAPIDTTQTLTATDIRLQQILVELRVLNLMSKEAFQTRDDPDSTGLRADVLAQDVALSS